MVRIEQSDQGLRFADSLGALIGVIQTKKKNETSNEVPQLEGQWHGDRLEVVQKSPRGGQSTQSYHLADDGRTLEVRTRMERLAGPAREFVRVYRRQGA